MPCTKRQLLRYRIIDRELSRGIRVKTKRIQEILINEHDHKVSTRTLQNDIELMKSDSQLKFYAPIEYDTSAQAFYYSKSDYSIQKFGLREDEINSLRVILNVFKQYGNHGILQTLVSAIEKIESVIRIERGTRVSDLRVWDRVLVEPLASLSKETAKLIPLLVEATDQKRKIKFEYKKFEDAESTWRKCIPAWLKEYKGLWYLVAEEESGKRKTFALDRILQLKVLEEHGEAESIDIAKYYYHSMGITVDETEPDTIILSFSPHTGNYVKASPVHHTQEIIIDDNEELRVLISVVPSYELYSKLLSYGSDVKIISPESVKTVFMKKLHQTINNYS